MQELIENAELLAFTKTVEASSVSRAALELRVPRATIGRRLQRLEERLGVRLLRRTTRRIALTDAGEALYRQARVALDAVRQAEASVRRTDTAVRGEVRLAVPPFSAPSFYALLNDFVKAYPDVRLSVHFSTQHVDLFRGGFDVAMRGSSVLEPGLVARMILRAPMVAVASPVYLARSRELRGKSDLRHHSCLLSFTRGEVPQTHWTDRKGRKIHVEGSVVSNDIAFLRDAARAGHGIAFLPEPVVRASIAAGELVRVLAKTLEGETSMAIVYPEREFIPPQVRAFIKVLGAWADREKERDLWPAPPLLASLPKKRVTSRARRART